MSRCWSGFLQSVLALLWLASLAAFGFQLEPPAQDIPGSSHRLVSWVGAWEGAGQMSPKERLHQLIVIDRENGSYSAELYQFRFPKDGLPIPLGQPQIQGNRIGLALANLPARFEGKLNRKTGQLHGRWIWRETVLDDFVLAPVNRRDVNRIRYPLGKLPERKVILKYKRPRKAEPGLSMGRLQDARLKWHPLQGFLKRIVSGEFGRIHGVLIAHQNQLILEQYFFGFQIDDLHEIRSVQKSLIALLIMKLWEVGKLPDLDAPIWNYFDAAETKSWEDVRKKQITIRHLLTMTSGLDASNYGNETVMQQQSRGDWVGYMLDAPQSQTPGKGFEYHSGGMNLLVGLAEKVSGQSTQNLLRQYFFDPMAIGKTYFYHDPSGRLYGAGGGAMRPRDLRFTWRAGPMC